MALPVKCLPGPWEIKENQIIAFIDINCEDEFSKKHNN